MNWHHFPPRALRLHTLLGSGLLGSSLSIGSSLLVGCSGSVDDAGGMATAGPSGTLPPGVVGSEPFGTTPLGSGTAPVGTGPGTTGTDSPIGTVPPVGAGGAGATPVATTPTTSNDCVGTEMAATKRIVRLSFNQIANTIGSLLDPALAPELATQNAILDSKHRAFPPLQSPREGGVVTDVQWTTIDAMAAAAASHVLANFDATTGCGAAPTDTCAQEFLATFAERAYRRPLTTEETTRVDELYTVMKNDNASTIEQAVQHGVYALLQTPQFLYRTELGADFAVDGALTQYELASALSYFLTDDMPDQELLDAAAAGALTTPDQVAAQVERIMQTPEAMLNLQDAMLSYFNYQGLENIVIQDDDFTDGVRNSMYHEGELFLERTLWNGELNDLLLSKTSVVNEGLAEVYGISPFPPPGAMVDADGFAEVTLPADRSGIVTMPGFLSTRSRPTETSVVGRGLLIKNAFLCTDTPPPPADLAETIEETASEQADQTSREQSLYRQETPPCSTCHASFDQYGLALENYDVIGRYRTMDDDGRPIDPSVVLPPQVGGGEAANMVEVALQIAETGAFAKCMGRNLINYALADTSAGAAEITGCAAQSVADAYEASGDPTFTSLVRAVAASRTFANRGAAQ